MSKTKVLIIEDEDSIAAFFSECLSESNYDVVEILDNGKDALSFLENISHIDVILMDIALKGELNGIESAKAIKSKFDIPIVFVTGNTAKEVYEKAREVNPSGYILKPVKKDELIRCLDIAVQNYQQLHHKKIIQKEIQFRSIIEEVGERGFRFFEHFLSDSHKKNLVISTNTRFNIINQPEDSYDVIINLKKINNIRRINKFFEAINHKLPTGGIFIGNAQTKGLKKKMMLEKYPWGINYIIYTFYFFLKRVWPKLPVLKQIYFFITKGRNRSLSRAEVLGRLISCGFEIVEEAFIESNLHFIAQKTREPYFDMEASYDLIFKMRRVGKNGKIINVYKFRTMHPFSEYIQDYVIKKHGYNESGKPNHDFRLTSWGRVFRKYWIDELPQLINVIKGNMKIVGVRPVSLTRFNEFPDDVKEERIKHKPGCIPPYVALLMPDEKANIEAEKIYFKDKKRNPCTTDIKYFFKAIYNIATNKIRSS